MKFSFKLKINWKSNLKLKSTSENHQSYNCRANRVSLRQFCIIEKLEIFHKTRYKMKISFETIVKICDKIAYSDGIIKKKIPEGPH
jgi:hypothetical protein